ncbi:Crp/Fnr family transcriptional regulator [Dysgonomonas sp. 25]|uniref:Crp/Fnr family transcriptional regulator n=1 Tax=Dysgonomonas sp. 25 TaxID=2302933 RepID=UPI0013D3809C|nr:Crp/Fnr family transcriptional regulator [Dysgonomonas sp. 25]NDV69461.1 Crp/Fnr family transcriptional regulator [Dysgonomonas sp. 25]
MKETHLTDEQIRVIHKIPLFRGVSDEFKETMLDKMDYAVYEIKKGEIVIRQDTPCNHMHILLRGNLEVNIIDVSGNNVKVENIVAPRSFATPHLFNDNNIFPATFTAIEETILLKATKESVFKIISSEPELLKNFLRLTGNCNACTVSRLRILSYKSIRSRFIYYILNHKKSDGLAVMEHNQTQLAEYLCVTRPALANELKKMSDEGLIRTNGKEVEILSVAALMKYI